MNSNVNPVVAAIVIVLAIAAGGLWMWLGGKAIEIGGPAEIRVAPSGHLFIQMQNRLLEHDANGEFVREHDLSAIGVDVFLGGFDFFADGTILLRRGPDPRSFGDNIRSFQRRENIRPLTPSVPDSGMARCDIDSWKCETFGPLPIDFVAAVSVEIDRDTGTVYISDTTRHRVRKYSAGGEALAAPAEGFRFPNDMEMHDGNLFVAVTNHHVVRQIATDNEIFGQALASHDVVPHLARVSGQEWPAHFTRVSDTWWVNNMKSGMDEGGLFIFDEDWNYLRRVGLPDNADPIALVAFGGEVLVTDWNNDRVHRVSQDGERIGDFSSAGLSQLVSASQEERQRYRIYGYAGVANIVLIMIVLIARGTDWRRGPPGEISAEKRADMRGTEPVTFQPEPRNVRKTKIGLRVAAILLVTIVVLLAVMLVIAGSVQMLVEFVLPLTIIAAIYTGIAWFQKAIMKSSIRFDVDRITLSDHKGREVSSPYHAVHYSEAAVVAGDIAVFLGQPQMPIYDREALIDELRNRIPDDRRLSELRMQARLIALRHPQGMLIVVAILSAIAIGGYLVASEILG